MTEVGLLIAYLNGLWKRRWIVLLGAWVAVAPAWPLVASMPVGRDGTNLTRATELQLAVVRPTIPAPDFKHDGLLFDYELQPPDDTEYRIVELQAKLRALLSQYTDDHPDVISTRRQLDELLRRLKPQR